nr:MAG: replication polyprotein [Owegonang virus 34]
MDKYNDYMDGEKQKARTPKDPQGKHWVFTINNYTEADKLALDTKAKDASTYLIYGEEIGDENGTPHYQGYIELRDKGMRTGQVCTLLGGRASVRIARGNSQHNKTYCSKQGTNIVEYGIPSVTGPQRIQRDWVEIKKLAIENKLDEIEPQAYVQHYNTLKTIARDHQIPAPHLTGEHENEWHWGPSRTGKSHYARTTWPDAYIKTMDQWWCGYTDQETVIIEDVGPYNVKHTRDFKIWADMWNFPADQKNRAAVRIRPKRIIVTSNYKIEDIWGHTPTELEPMLERFKVIYHGKLKKYDDTDVVAEVVETPPQTNEYYNIISE